MNLPSPRGLWAFVALLAVSIAALPAQVPPAPTGPRVFPAPLALRTGFDITAGTVQQLAVPQAPQQPFTVEMILAGAVRQVLLAPHDVRTPGFQLLVADHVGITTAPVPPSITYRGFVAGEPSSQCAATVVSGRLTAVIFLEQGGTWGVQHAREVDPTAGPTDHVVYHSTDLRNLPFTCGTNGPGQPIGPGGSIDMNSICDLGCEADFPFFQANGSNVTATQNDVTAVVNAMDVIYRRDVQIQYNITTILVRSSPDPYTSTNAGTLLSQFRNQWNATMGSVVRDTAHLFTGRNLDGSTIGIATLGVVCNIGSAYGLSQSRFTSNFQGRTALTAHEVGHNWNAGHCNSSSDCRIMCSGLGGCTGIITSFGASAQSQILAFKNTRGCLTQAQTTPVITSASPNTIRTFMPPQVTLTGTGFTGTTQVQVGSTILTSGSFSVLTDTRLVFTPPEGLVGFATLQVTNASGPSNPTLLIYIETAPPVLAAPPAAIGGQILTWRFGGRYAHHWYLLVGLGNQTSPLQGWPVMQSFTLLGIGVLDAAGIGSFAVPVPSMILNGITVHSQMLDVDPTAIVLSGSTAVMPTTIFF